MSKVNILVLNAVANAFSPSYRLLGISLSDLELNCANLTLTVIVDRRPRSKTSASGNVLTCQENFPALLLPAFSFYIIVLCWGVYRCPSNHRHSMDNYLMQKAKQKMKALKLDCTVVPLISFFSKNSK